MSERSKGDTSSSVGTAAPPTSGRVVKNPLLSASVTGLTFDDFQNKPLLLPAAPPIVHPTPVVSRESTPLVTVGKLSDIDTENLSEINLNDTSVTSSLSSNIAEPSDENSNSLLESTNQIDNSILSQAASSFSQLPSVASSVFSTFSKKFNSTSGRDDFNANPQLDIQPFTTPFVGQVSVPQPQIPPPPTVFANEQHHQQQQQIALPPQTQPQAPTAVPPTFYTPTEVPSAPSAPTCPPPASGQNTYRLSARKKIYAQIPGLSSAQHEPSLPTSATGFQPPIGFEALGAPTYSENPPFEKPEERKGGLFSLSNLGVPNVLQNLSGFVQSATGISQRPQEQPSAAGFGSIGVAQATPPAYYPQSSPSNFTGIEPVQTTSTGVNFFAPPVSSAPQLFIPAQVPPVLPGSTLPPQPPKGPPTTGVLYSTQPTEAGQSISTQQQTFFEPTTSSSRPPSVGSYFGGQLAKSSTPDNKPDLKAFEPHQPSQPEFNSEKTFSGSSTNLFRPPPTTGSKFSEQPPTSVTPESSPQLNLSLEQTTSGPPPNLFGAPSTAESNLSVPLQSVTPELTTQTNLEFKQAVSGPPSNSFGPLPGAGSKISGSLSSFLTPNFFTSPTGLPLTSLPPDIPLSPQVKPISVTPASPSQEDLNSQQTISSPPPTLFGALPTSESNLSGATSQSVTPELTKQPNLNSEQPVSTPASNFFGLPPVAGSYISGPPPKSDTAESLSKANFFPSPSSGLPLTPGIPLPPQVKPQISGPPSAGPPSSSFRLQKGTRLYKSPFAVAQSENQPQVQIYKNNSAIDAEPVSYFNPQQTFAPPQGEVIPQPIPTQEPLPPKDNSFLHSSVTAPPLCKASGHPPTADGINYFNPQKFDSGTGIPYFTRTAAPLNILEPTAASERISTNPINFFNPQGLNSAPELIDLTKGVAPASIQQPLAGPEGVNPQDITPHSLGLDTETVSISANLSSVADQNLSNKENYLSNQAPEQRKSPPLEEVSKINPESDIKQERLNLLQEQQNNILPPPPSVNFGITTQSKETANFPPPPPQHSFQNKPISNPYRKGLQPGHSQLAAPPSLSSFFTPIDQGNNFFQPITSGPIPETQQPAANFVTEANIVNPQEKPLNLSSGPLISSEDLSQKAPKLLEETSIPSENLQPSIELSELEPNLPIRESTPISSVIPEQNQLTSGENISEASEKPASPRPAENPLSFYKRDIAPPYSNDLQVASKPEESSKIASPLKSQDTPVPEPVPNLFTGFFDQAAASSVAAPNPVLVQRPSLPDPTTFFDSFSLVPSLGVPAPPTEDPNSQRIQNFFNNPPPKELDTVGDLNYNLVGSGLSVQNLQIRSLTPASNLAEPPSSSCSEFSELNSSLSAANRQPLIQAADSTKVSPEEEAIFESPEYQDLPEEIVNELKMANSLLGNSSPTNEVYKPAVKHWFYKRKLDVKCLWTPFSFHDSALIEEAYLKGDKGPNLVPVEGGRFDVNISERTKSPVYWEGEPIEVKRCSWFFKANDSKYVPYEEETADLLEEEYKKASESCEWHKKIPIMAGETVVFHGPTVIVHFQPQQQVDSWGGSTQTITRPRVVKRDLDDFNIDEGESHKVDHLLFMVHGIGSACDLKMRSVEEVVDEFRSIALQLVQSHYKNSVENGCVGRVEVLPVSWHSELHSDEFGIDEKLKSITLESIPKLRNFTNDTLLDILFYTSPMFCQRIINTVTSSMNDIFVKYKQRNPEFHGEVSLAGHSLGSLIMFDLLCHQRPHKQNEEKNMENPDEMTSDFPVESNQLKEEEEGKNITYKMGQAGTGQPFISYPQLLFQPKKFFALGSPIGMFVTIRGIDKLGLDFRLPTCPGFYNIFHPYDPVAYRLEALVNPDMNGIPPVLIPHHKGRKRMHLELKETMSRVGADLKQRFFETFKTTLDSVNFLTPKIKNDPKELKEEVDRLLELQAQQGQQTQQSIASTSRSRANSNSTNQSDTDAIEIDFPLGKLNDSKRVDYVLQEAPLEFFNEYLFALSSHVCYWESEDTILFVMKQIYNEIGISPDSQVPQQTMTIERPSSSGSTTQQSPTS